MEGLELLEITFMKFYGKIDDVTNDHNPILTKLCKCRLIKKDKCKEIANIPETLDKNRCLIDALRQGVQSIEQLNELLRVLKLDSTFHEIANNMEVVYRVLMNEENIVKGCDYSKLLACLKKKKFFTKHDETILSTSCNKAKQIIEILKDKELDSFRTFLTCLEETHQGDLVSKVVSLSYKHPCYSLDSFKHFLHERYTTSSFTGTSDIDFNLPVSDCINIALIEISEMNHREGSTFFDYYSLLLKQDSSYSRQFLDSYSDVVVENCRVILIQGYPGSGKTFLAKKICTNWAKGKLLQEFKYVMFLQLRDGGVASAESFDELVELYLGSCSSAKMIINEIYESIGKGVLIILEGWDELPERRQHDSLFTRLISGDVLPKAVVLITSRPSAIRSLEYAHIERRIEILGFTDEQVKQNITCYFSNSSELEQQFRSELNRLPLLKCFVFVPINLCIVLYIFDKSNGQLPNTFTDIYKNLVLIQLRRHQARNSHGSSSINTLNDLPEEVDEMLLRLSKMAYYCLQNNVTLTFDEAKIRQYCFSSSDENLDGFDGMGLLQITNHRHFESYSKTYEFIHRTLQELLAAWYLSCQPKSFQLKQLQSIFDQKELEMVWIFYAGLTKFTNASFKDILSANRVLRINLLGYKIVNVLLLSFASKVFLSYRFRGTCICKAIERQYGGIHYSSGVSHYISREFQCTLIAAVMEAQNPELCRNICDSHLFYGDTCWFSVPGSAATPQILSALSYCIAHSGKKWIVQCKMLDSSQADNLLKYLVCEKAPCNKCGECVACNINPKGSIYVLDIHSGHNQVDGSLKLLQPQINLQWLILSFCTSVNDEFVLELAKVLAGNTSLKKLHLTGCNVTSNGIKVISHMLKKNKTLSWIGLADNVSKLNEKDIAFLLKEIRDHNNTVNMIFMDSVFHTSEIVQEQLQIVNYNRQERGVEKLSLTLLDVFKHRDICQKIFSKLPFMQNQKLPLSISGDIQPSGERQRIFFGAYPIRIVCPECNEEMDTKVAHKIGSFTWVLILILLLTFLLPLVPCVLCINQTKDVSHSCSKCNALLGVYQKL
ncbi:protein NLRC3-like isoform X1 [Dysidea avara]|uniref:protein NLRC3-like isoform X1 n=2 Tax=Dysidea avara TaxID=196820 RepID=UPI003334A4DE